MFGFVPNPVSVYRTWRRVRGDFTPEPVGQFVHDPVGQYSPTNMANEHAPSVERAPVLATAAPESLLTNARAMARGILIRASGNSAEVARLKVVVALLAVLSWMHYNTTNDRYALLMAVVFSVVFVKLNAL